MGLLDAVLKAGAKLVGRGESELAREVRERLASQTPLERANSAAKDLALKSQQRRLATAHDWADGPGIPPPGAPAARSPDELLRAARERAAQADTQLAAHQKAVLAEREQARAILPQADPDRLMREAAERARRGDQREATARLTSERPLDEGWSAARQEATAPVEGVSIPWIKPDAPVGPVIKTGKTFKGNNPY